MRFERATLDFEGAVAILTLDHREAMNAASVEMLGGLNAALTVIEEEERVRCILLTGAGRAFCSGANLQGGRDAIGNVAELLDTVYHPFLLRLRRIDCPFITVVNGPAAGAGMTLALMGDMILCGRSAYFLQAFRRIGLVPDSGSTWVLPRLIGRARALELSLMGERLSAEKALEWGLVNRVYDDAVLMEEALKLAQELARGPTIALSLTRRLYWESMENSYEQQLRLECESQAVAAAAEDFREGVAAFLAKRPATFTGK
ncbi:MAG: enoyl-CoA hydratase/isomerase [Alphaproteobacteria bacterium]|nr:enoyl-CoA hydratase/isomerase [Alphaproteobacteria bacterium]